MNDVARIVAATYAPSDSEAFSHYGPDPCWTWERENQSPETCKDCRGRVVAGTPVDSLASGLNPKTGNVVAFVCAGCGRSLVRTPRGRLMPPNQDALDAYGDLQKRDTADRTAEAVRLGKRAKGRMA